MNKKLKRIIVVILLSLVGCGKYQRLIGQAVGESSSETTPKFVQGKEVRNIPCCDPSLPIGTQILCLDLKNAPDHSLESPETIYHGTCFN